MSLLQLLKSASKRPSGPKTADKTARSRELILRVLLIFTLVWLVAASAILLVGIVLLGHAYLWPRLIAIGAVTALVGMLYFLMQKGHARAVSYVLVAMYLLMVIGAYFLWGIYNLPALMLAAFVVIMSGILLGSRYALYVAAIDLSLLFYVNNAFDQSLTSDDIVTNSNIVFLGVILGLIALISWLYNDRMEQSLRRAERSEAALKRQRDLLEATVEERTKKLQAIQMEQLQQVYRFAELGLLSTELLHDLANHLSSISVDIEGLSEESSSEILNRIKRTIGYIDNSVNKTRQQLEGRETTRQFSVNKALTEVVKLLTYKAEKAGVDIEIAPAGQASPALTGDITRFKQLLTNLIANAIEAYDEHHEDRRIIIHTTTGNRFVAISITDYGRGMTEKQQAELFKPFYTTKKKGMGLGLFIAKEITEKSFGGKLEVASEKAHGAVFAIKLPLEK
jgi:two-component system, NtrC family, sensor kinase